MPDSETFLKSGHAPTLFAPFLCFDVTFAIIVAIWVLNGTMAPSISKSFGLTAAQKGFMVSVPIIAGALMRFPLFMLCFASHGAGVLWMMHVLQIRWTRTWAEKGGRARTTGSTAATFRHTATTDR